MAIILDADVIIRGEKGTFDLRRWLASRPGDLFEVAAVTIAELWHGVERASVPHKQRRQQYLQAVLAPLPIWNVNFSKSIKNLNICHPG